MAGRKYGLDLGTNYVKIYDNTRKNILVENNMIAIRKKKGYGRRRHCCL